jgi:hypothetical protein
MQGQMADCRTVAGVTLVTRDKRPNRSNLMSYFCIGCRQLFDTSKAVAAHRRFCDDYKNAASNVLLKRRNNFETFQARKRSKISENQQDTLGIDPGEGEDVLGMDLVTSRSIFYHYLTKT